MSEGGRCGGAGINAGLGLQEVAIPRASAAHKGCSGYASSTDEKYERWSNREASSQIAVISAVLRMWI